VTQQGPDDIGPGGLEPALRIGKPGTVHQANQLVVGPHSSSTRRHPGSDRSSLKTGTTTSTVAVFAGASGSVPVVMPQVYRRQPMGDRWSIHRKSIDPD
jgi:hypothetical protein